MNIVHGYKISVYGCKLVNSELLSSYIVLYHSLPLSALTFQTSVILALPSFSTLIINSIGSFSKTAPPNS